MNAYYSYLNDLITTHKKRYSHLPEMKWLSPYEADAHEEQRNSLLLPFRASTKFKGTKPFLNGLSKGCELCGQGLWSCLFIAGKCNAGCFYCPAPQDLDDLPQSQGLTFPTPESYAEYVQFFKFKGVAFSGGEPLLAIDKVLAYTRELRKVCGPDLYIWMYTNGLLASRSVFQQLAEAGINEVRFDIGATAYKLDAIAKARGLIQHISVEIPAVPEERERLKKMLPELLAAGVTHLNLHQMRLTPHNAKHLLSHNYTYVPAEQPIVLESEMAALEIMNYANEKHIPIGINYCSFFFKNRFQKAGYRRTVAKALGEGKGEITEKGFIRKETPEGIQYLGIVLADAKKLSGEVNFLVLTHEKYAYQQRIVANLKCNRAYINEMSEANLTTVPTSKEGFEIWMHENIEEGLRAY